MKKKNKNTLSNTILIIFLICGGITLGLHMSSFGIDNASFTKKLLYLAVFFIFALFVLLLHTIVHEAGHLVFGLLSGYRFSSFRIFSFMILKKDGRLITKKLSLAGTAGQCLMAPPDNVKPENIPFVLYNLGGALMNCIFSVLSLFLYLTCREVPYLSSALLFICISGILFALVNALPRNNGIVCNDGANIKAIKDSPDARRAFWLQLTVNAAGTKGLRFRDMPDEWFDFPDNGDRSNQITCASDVMLVDRLMDTEKFSEAEAVCRRLLSDECPILGMHRTLIVCNLVCISLLNGRTDDLNELMTEEQKKLLEMMKTLPPIIRTQYFIALLYKNDKAESDRYLELFEKSAKNYPYESDIESERDFMALAKEFSEK